MNFKLCNTLATWLTEARIPHEPAMEPSPHLRVPSEHWFSVASLAQGSNLRLVAEWASQQGEEYNIHAAYAMKGQGYALVETRLAPGETAFPSLVPCFNAAARMERIIHDLFGLTPTRHPDLRPWIKHESWPENSFPLRKTFSMSSPLPRREGHYEFIGMEGEGGYEIPVGPVHAGIIEPGHFRFSAVGETILNLEERLGYVHKGIEKQMESRDVFSALRLAARVSGDATVAHSWAFCLAVEQAAGVDVSRRAAHIRAILCERERMANHIGDIGAICNDAAWTFMQMQCQRLREDLARLHQRLFEHRLLMDCVVPGGVTRDLDAQSGQLLRAQTGAVAREMKELFQIYEDQTSIRERVIGSGGVSERDAHALGLVGFAGRSAEQDIDARRDAAYPPYDQYPPQVKVCRGGDVSARLWIRFEEIQASAALIAALIDNLPKGSIQQALPPLVEGRWGFAAVESWRGEIATWLQLGRAGRINRCYVRDPSMLNWLGLELAVREVPVPDFPLNNKSFNCSYSGHDL